MPVFVIGLSHRTSPVEVRERLAMSSTEVPVALQELRADGVVAESVILSTCNRVEVYAATPVQTPTAQERLKQFFEKRAQGVALGEGLYLFEEPQSLEHLFKVASGLDSMVLGETEILGQLKTAYELARQHQHTGPRLNKAFQRAFNVAKHIRTETNIQRGSISVASVAVELAEHVFGTLAGHQVMVIGAGDTGEKTARALLSRGAKGIVVTNRSVERAQTLATALGGRAVAFESWADEFASVDIVISSTAAPLPILDRPRLEPLMNQRKHRPLLLIDIAVPRDIAPEVNDMDDVFLYNIDHLQTIADGYLRQRQEEVTRCLDIIREKVRGLLQERRPDLPAGSPATAPTSTNQNTACS
jgi:glutamyl-tRNA reductase